MREIAKAVKRTCIVRLRNSEYGSIGLGLRITTLVFPIRKAGTFGFRSRRSLHMLSTSGFTAKRRTGVTNLSLRSKPSFLFLAVATYASVFGCEAKNDLRTSVGTMTSLFNLEYSLRSFRDRHGQVPEAGDSDSCRSFFANTSTGRQLKKRIFAAGLNVNNLDQDELVLLFAVDLTSKAGQRVGGEFEPNHHYLTDNDSDGFYEYHLPAIGLVKLRPDAFEIKMPNGERLPDSDRRSH